VKAAVALLLASAFLAPAASMVTIDGDKNLLVNGRKVFPITMSPGPPTRGRTPTGVDALKELREAGTLIIRMLQTNDWNAQVRSNQQAQLDWAQEQGMFCMVNLREVSAFAAGDTATEAALRDLVNQFKNHPALAVWKNKDEAWWGKTSAEDLKRGYDVIRQEDPNHPVEQTHAPRGTVADLRPYNAAADILALDIYPVSIPPGKHSLLPNKQISMVGDWTKFLADVANGEKSYWMVEQIAFSGVIPPQNTLIFPTFRQSRYMAYQAIINGARGLMFFGGNIIPTLNAQDAPLAWNWTFWDDVLKRVVREIGDHSALAPALVAPISALPITMSGTTSPDLEFSVREVPPYLYIMASKREGATTNVTFDGLPAWASAGEVMYESPRTVTAKNGQFTDSFAPFDVHVYRFSQTNRAPIILQPPQSRTNNPGIKASFNVIANGTGPLAYQWRKDAVDLLGETAPELAAWEAGSYDVVVTGFGGITSAPAALVVVPYTDDQVPVITSQPQSRENYPGTTATFSVGSSGNGPFAHQWRKDGTNIPDARSWTLIISNVSEVDAGGYDVVVTGFTSVTSAPAALTLLTPQPNQLIFYEPFDYWNIGSPVSSNMPANWTYNGNPPNDLSVVSGNLAYAGLAVSVGNSVTNGGFGLGVRRLFGSNVNSGVLYFSALFRMNNPGYGTWNGAASQVGALTANDNTSFRLAVMVRSNTPSGYVIGVQKGGTGATATFDGTQRHAGDTIFLVGKYDFTVSPDAASLWINPAPSTFGANTEPTTGFITATTGTDDLIIDRFNFRQNTAASVPAAMQWDELRVGLTWASVTPPSPPTLTNISVSEGVFQFFYTNTSAQTYTVFASPDFMNWEPIGPGTQISPGCYQFTDSTASEQRFFHLRSP
jgi:hypothetical protein